MGNLIIDGDMELSGVTYYPPWVTSTITKSADSPHGGTQALRVAWLAGNNNPAACCSRGAGAYFFPVGHRVRMTGWARGDGTHRPYIVDSALRWTGSVSASWQAFDLSWTAVTGAILLRTYISEAGWIEFDDLAVYDVSASAQYYHRNCSHSH